MSISKRYKVIGVMTGTSMDGVDCSYIYTDGKGYLKIIKEKTFTFSNVYRKKLKKFIFNLPIKKNLQEKYIIENEDFITKEIVKILKIFIKMLNDKKVDFIGISGQTIFHNPQKNYSIQIGSGKRIYENLKIPVISNFRENDMKYGGQGAPIGAFYHKYLINKINKKSVILNIGGVANITYIYKNILISYDVGPGNALIDDLADFFYKKKYDKSGNYAKKGILIKKIYNNFKKNKFFNKSYPKSLDRNNFADFFVKLKKYNKNDAIHTASKMTVYSITKEIINLNSKIENVVITGGGRKNNFILNEIDKNLDKNKIKIYNIDNFGFNGDLIESQMFGYIAVRSFKKLPLSIPTTTGVPKPISGGKIYCN